MSRSATIPPVHDSAVASVSAVLAAEIEHELLDRALVAAEEVALEGRDEPFRQIRPRGLLRPGSTTRSTWISKSRAQIVASTPSPSPPASASAFATVDSLAPKKRS